MTSQTPPWRRGNWRGLSEVLSQSLVEPVPTIAGQAISVIHKPSKRLSRSGQLMLGVVVSILAGFLYNQTFASNQKLIQRFGFCLPLPSTGQKQTEAAEQTQSLINKLTQATSGQKLRLSQQYKLLVSQSARLCAVASLYRSQESALLTVATSALCLLSLTMALGLTHGLVNNNNRTLNTLQITAGFLLVVPILFLQLGEQIRDTPIYDQIYLAHRDLIQELQSALANQDLPPLRANPAEGNGRAASYVPALTDNSKVAELIRRIDNQLESLPPFPLSLDDSTVIRVYSWLSNSWKQSITK
ncbi:MAG: hypothetical protein VKO39_04405 [Cyanobacteriota bacterium]|nr:hypothetical protein [Cyanobacteriota bacterium]